MALASVLAYFQSFVPGFREVDGGDCQQMANMLFQPTTGLTALAGGGQTGATPLKIGLNRVDTCASDNDSVMLPPAIAGSRVVIYNNTGHTLAVFGQPANAGGGSSAGDTIAAANSNTQQPTATGITMATTVTSEFMCFVNGQWKQAYLS